jgi:mannose-6-phosphate isomerase-like protein (cupin superfamily)
MMINPGDTLVNSATGEELTFLETAASTGGEYVEVVCVVQPGGAVAAAHVHPRQSETFTTVEGTLNVRVGKELLRLGQGESATVEAGTAHRFWNEGDEPVAFHCRISPALQFESLIETMFGLARDGKTNRKGMPNPVRMASIARAHRDVIRLAGVPAWLQDIGTLGVMPLASLAGYGAGYQAVRPILA